MLSVDKRMIALLQSGVTFSKLKSKTGMCSSELVKRVHRLESNGYLIHRLFTEQGVKFKILDEPLKPLHDNIKIDIIDRFSCIATSDSHIGNIYENLELLKKLYRYAEEHNIRYIIHLGDMVEGPELENGRNNRIKRFDINDQVNYLTRYYPKSDKVDTLYILGNHDDRCKNKGIDISEIITRRRMDMHFLGYKNSSLKIGNVNVLLHHPFSIERSAKYDDEVKDLYLNPDFDLILRGHTHHNDIYVNDMNSLVVDVSACYNSPSRDFVTAYEVTIKNSEILLDNLIIGDKISKISTVKHKLLSKSFVEKIH